MIRDLADDFNFELENTTKPGLIRQVKSWIATNRPNHEKIGREYVFDIRLEHSHTRILTELSKVELELVVKNYNLPTPKPFTLKQAL